ANAPISAADKAAFTSLLKEGNPEKLWDRAKAAGVSDQGINVLKLQGQLAYLTLNNVGLVIDLQQKIGNGTALQLIDLDFDLAETWNKEIAGLATRRDIRLD